MPLKQLFPRYELGKLFQEFGVGRWAKSISVASRHDLLVKTVEMLEGPKGDGEGYRKFIELFGFHNEHTVYEGHCHQRSPIVGAVLLARYFSGVAYLQCAQVDSDNRTKLIEPHTEPDPERRAEFQEQGYIPYCCVETYIDGQRRYVSPKHLRMVDGRLTTLLRKPCHARMRRGEELVHPDMQFARGKRDQRSGIYLVDGRRAFINIGQGMQFCWYKWPRSEPQEKAETFMTFRRMELVL